MTGLHVVGFGATVQGHFEACALRRFWASLLPAAVVEVAVVICLKSLLSSEASRLVRKNKFLRFYLR